MKSAYISLFAIASAACGAAPTSSETSGDTEQASSPSCPANDDVAHAAATVAFALMRDSAIQAAGNYPEWAGSILASQRYRIQASGTGIEFDPTDNLYTEVTDQMRAHLAFAQQDAGVAKYLSDGLKYDYATTDGTMYPEIRSIPALLKFNGIGPLTVVVPDSTSSLPSGHTATLTGSAWCGTSLVTINEAVQASWQFAPIFSQSLTIWRGTVPAYYKGKSSLPTIPFNGASSAGNAYLVVTLNGATTNWAKYNYTPASCYNFPNQTCHGSVQIDPVPYAEPGQYFDMNNNPVGTQSNPFSLNASTLYATPDHAGQWATRVVNGVQQWGTFSQAVTIYGTTEYKYVRQI